MNKRLNLIGILLFLLLGLEGNAWGEVHKSRYVTLSYNDDKEVLRGFNDNLRLNRKLSYSMRKKNVVTVADEVLAKVDIIIEKAQVVLDMFPDNYHIKLILLPDDDAVARVYKEKYGKAKSFPHFNKNQQYQNDLKSSTFKNFPQQVYDNAMNNKI